MLNGFDKEKIDKHLVLVGVAFGLLLLAGGYSFLLPKIPEEGTPSPSYQAGGSIKGEKDMADGKSGPLHLASNFSLEISAQAVGRVKNAMGAVVPHHLLAHPVISKTLETLSEADYETVVIMCPNHFDAGTGEVITSADGWQTQYGALAGDPGMGNRLIAANLAEENYDVLEKEHGIFDLAPYIKYYFPKAKVVPLVVRDNLTDEEMARLAGFLDENLPERSLVLVSADFSHYLPANAAYFHDQTSIAALNNFDYGTVKELDVDTPASLAILMKYLELKEAKKFILTGNKNSLDFTGGTAEETTSYVSGYFLPEDNDLKRELTLQFLGDMMLDRNVLNNAKKKNNFEFPLEKMKLFFKGVNFTIANLEGPLTDNPSVSNGTDRLTFTFSPQYLPVLKKYFDVFSLANNHTLNFGSKGLAATWKYLDKYGIKHFGDPSNTDDKMTQVIEKNGLKTALIGYHALYKDTPDKVVAEINKVRAEADYIIVYPHWGVEYERKPSKSQVSAARQFIDAGADLIIGSHPHVIQTIEEYKGKYIFYSLGNFIFDQYFSKETQEGLSVGVDLEKAGREVKASYYIFPIAISKLSQAELAKEKQRKEILNWLADNSAVDEATKTQIRNGIISGK